MGNAYDSASLLVTPNGYKASKIYSAKPTDGTGDLAFSRASTAMRRNSAGLWEEVANNVPRLQYPVGGGCPSWLFEPQATNVLEHSNTLSNVLWIKNACSIVSEASTPSTDNSWKLVENTANDSHHIYQNVTGTGTNTFSFYAKAGERTFVYAYSDNAAVGKCFNLSNGTLGANIIGAPTSSSITDAGNGWYLCSITVTITVSTAFRIGTCITDGVFSYLGDGTSGIYVWNAQLESGSVATSPIITAGSAVTRLADVSRTAGLSSIIGQTEGTIFIEFNNIANLGVTQGLLFAAGGGSNYIGIYRINTDIVFEIVSGGVPVFLRTIAYADGKAAITYANNSMAAFFNGAKVGATDTSGTPPTTSIIDFGSYSSSSPAQGNVKDAILYTTALSDSEAIELTTL
jgi:hypothetical protein